MFQMTSELTLAEGYLDSGLRDVRGFKGQEVLLQFALRSDEPGAAVFVRNLTFWKDQWNGNSAPVAEAGPDQTVVPGADGLGVVVLDGRLSHDPDGDELHFTWLEQGELVAAGAEATVKLPVGSHEITLSISDPADHVSVDTALMVVQGSFRRGDSNGDGEVDISDAVFILFFLFAQAGPPLCMDAADVNDSGTVDLSDAIYALAFLFTNGLVPPSPGPAEPGYDTTSDDLGCTGYPE